MLSRIFRKVMFLLHQRFAKESELLKIESQLADGYRIEENSKDYSIVSENGI